jgi:serine/threonine protein kinase
MIKVLQAIRYLSERNLCHNYINTSNILFSRDGEMKLGERDKSYP